MLYSKPLLFIFLCLYLFIWFGWFLFIYSFGHAAGLGHGDILVPRSGVERRSLAVKVQSPNRWHQGILYIWVFFFPQLTKIDSNILETSKEIFLRHSYFSLIRQ